MFGGKRERDFILTRLRLMVHSRRNATSCLARFAKSCHFTCGLHEGNTARYRLRPSELTKWRTTAGIESAGCRRNRGN